MKVLITGINGGIGMSIAKSFKESEYGYKVCGLDLHSKETHPWCDHYIQFDLSDPNWDILFDDKFDVVINNAALQIVKPFFELSDEDIDNSFSVNLINVMKMIRRLDYNHGANIINIGSIHSSQTKSKFSVYATTKGGLETLTRSLSVELAPDIRVNMIKPAAIDTFMLRDGLDGEGYKKLSSYHPVNIIGKPEDVSNLIMTIIDNRFMNGSIIDLNGGISNVLNDPHD